MARRGRWLTLGMVALFATVWAATQQPLRPALLAQIKANYVGQQGLF